MIMAIIILGFCNGFDIVRNIALIRKPEQYKETTGID